MITLKVEDYCHAGCARFEPKTIIGLTPTDPDITVICEHRDECQYMHRYLINYGLGKETK